MKQTLLVLVFVLLAAPLFAQDHVSEQTRLLLHSQIGGNQWYPAVWIIGNVKSEQPDNVNFFAGIGKKFDKEGKTWGEAMLWRQQIPAGRNEWLINFRFRTPLRRGVSLYVEVAPYLTKMALFDQVIFEVETKASDRLRVGLETENIHQAGPDKIGAGPRASLDAIKRKRMVLTTTASYQFRRGNEPHVFRVWILLTIRKPKT